MFFRWHRVTAGNFEGLGRRSDDRLIALGAMKKANGNWVLIRPNGSMERCKTLKQVKELAEARGKQWNLKDLAEMERL